MQDDKAPPLDAGMMIIQGALGIVKEHLKLFEPKEPVMISEKLLLWNVGHHLKLFEEDLEQLKKLHKIEVSKIRVEIAEMNIQWLPLKEQINDS
jgi:hypothetical protein